MVDPELEKAKARSRGATPEQALAILSAARLANSRWSREGEVGPDPDLEKAKALASGATRDEAERVRAEATRARASQTTRVRAAQDRARAVAGGAGDREPDPLIQYLARARQCGLGNIDAGKALLYLLASGFHALVRGVAALIGGGLLCSAVLHISWTYAILPSFFFGCWTFSRQWPAYRDWLHEYGPKS